MCVRERVRERVSERERDRWACVRKQTHSLVHMHVYVKVSSYTF